MSEMYRLAVLTLDTRVEDLVENRGKMPHHIQIGMLEEALKPFLVGTKGEDEDMHAGAADFLRRLLSTLKPAEEQYYSSMTIEQLRMRVRKTTYIFECLERVAKGSDAMSQLERAGILVAILSTICAEVLPKINKPLALPAPLRLASSR